MLINCLQKLFSTDYAVLRLTQFQEDLLQGCHGDTIALDP